MELIGLSRVQRDPETEEERTPDSGKTRTKRDLLTRLAAWVLVLVFPLTLLVGTTGTAHANKEEDIDGLSFYRLSSSLTALFSTAQEPDSGVSFDESDAQGWDTLLANPASAGAMLGYADENYNPIAGWLNSRVAQSSDSVGYNTLVGTDDAGLDGVDGARDYALFGATLNGLGLDSTSTGLSVPFISIFAGGIIFLLYAATAILDVLWSMILSFLIAINPFQLFHWAVFQANPDFANGMVGGEPPEGFFGELSQWFGEWYLVLVNISWTVMVPIFIATFLLGIMMFQKLNKGGMFKKLVIRLFFLVLGLPLLGSMYTGMLNSMEMAAEEGNTGSTRVVLSTFVDFERWAMGQRLRVPDSDNGAVIEWNTYSNSPSGESQASVRDLALLINAQVMGIQSKISPSSGNSGDSWDGTALGGEEPDLSQRKYGEVADMLRRYMSNSHVLASSFETEAKSTLSGTVTSCQPDGDGDAPPDCSNERTWFEEYIGDPEDVVKTKENQVKVPDNPLLAVSDGVGLHAERAGSTVKFTTEGDVLNCGLYLSLSGGPRACNLSPLAMYNYLNTDFGETSYTAYSSGKTTSEATRSIHNSVNLVGTGLMSFVYWLHAVVILGAFATIGFGYAFAMLIGNIRRSFQLITAVPFATLGVISGIAKVIVYTIALLMEVVITLFLYKFIQEFLLSIPAIIEAPLAGVLNRNEAEQAAFVAFLLAGGFITMLITLVSIIVIILITIMAMRLRKTMVKAVEDASSKLIDKFTGGSSGGGGGGGAPGGRMPGGSGPGAKGGGVNRTMSGGGPKGGSMNAGGTSGAPAAANSTVSGNVDTDGKLEGPLGALFGGDDRSGSGLGSSEQDREADGQAELGRQVESEGLSDDPMEAFAGSARQSAAGYAEADKQRFGAGVEGAKAVGHGAVAAGRAAAGDTSGAAKSAGKAMEHAGEAQTKNAQAGKASQQAGKSSLDNPQTSARYDRKIQQGQQVKKAGQTVSTVAGATGGGGGGGTTGTDSALKATRQARDQKQPPKPSKKRRLY